MVIARILAACCLAGWLAGWAAAQEAPRRVLSMNLCTDQLAMMLAAPGQLISVSYMAQDPRASAMADEAAGYAVNYGRAEDIFLMQPDLVLAGSFTTPATVRLLRRLGVPVEMFDPAYSMADLRDNMRRMGAVLHREGAAVRAIERFDADLAALRDPVDRPPPRAAMYAAHGYSAGPDSLSGEIIAAAGLANVGAELGLGVGGPLPLELLMMAAPDLVITGHPYPGFSRAEEVLSHPGLRAIMARSPSRVLSDRDWVCGTPHVLRAVAELAEARRALQQW